MDDKALQEDTLLGDDSLMLSSRFALGFWFLEESREFIDLRVRTGVNLLLSEGLRMKLRERMFSGDKSSDRLFRAFF